jgi:hypothetical protein
MEADMKRIRRLCVQRAREIFATAATAGIVGWIAVLASTAELTMEASPEAGQIEASHTAGTGCSATTMAAFDACWAESRASYALALGACANLEDDDRAECLADALESRREEDLSCRAQRIARRDLCELLGDEPYDPDFQPELFDADFTRLARPNRYFPLTIGNRWTYRGGNEMVTIEIRNETKLIEGVRCLVVRDQVFVNGDLVEDTDDWFAQAKDGDVYYCGEEVKDFETFDGDNPRRAELVSTDGSFKVGRDEALAGIIFRGVPTKGEVYRQEFSLGNAEDVAEVLSTSYAFGTDPALDELVPRALMQVFCARDCVVTKDFSPLEPGVFERKYYAPGIGLILETNPGTGEVLRLTACSFDTRCGGLGNLP